MKLVPTSTPKEQEIDLDALMMRKAELKEQILGQKQQIIASSQHLFSPASFPAYFHRAFSKGLSLVDGVMVGLKVMRTIRSIFRR
ncbi:MAG TPA: hypothetical protein VFK73_05405 [Paludibacter sp.]|nr:hypothetical protein [Paludibacter sp.]